MQGAGSLGIGRHRIIRDRKIHRIIRDRKISRITGDRKKCRVQDH
jgi:hypothetical protein